MKRHRKPPMSEEEKVLAWEFKLSVQGKPCAKCGEVHPNMDAHHAVEQKHLKDIAPDRLWDKANAVPMCPSRYRPCHPNHTAATHRLRIDQLSGENVAFASEVLEASASDYLSRYYASPAVERVG